MKQFLVSSALLVLVCGGGRPGSKGMEAAFRNPPTSFRPMPFWHLNGALQRDTIVRQITDAKQLAGFGGVTVLPVSGGPQHPTGKPCPGMTPAYLSEEYFARYADMLATTKREKMELILYDDLDFPSGNAGGRLRAEFPHYVRKFIEKEEYVVTGPVHFSQPLSSDSMRPCMAVSAMNINSLQVVDLTPHVKEGVVQWDVPKGAWRIMFFNCRYNVDRLVDYMEPKAVKTFMSMTYDEYDKRFSNYFGNVIRRVFYDDVGYVSMEKSWNPEITRLFEKKYGKSAALYYPALYYDIGPETAAARVAFYDIRAELMAEGYPRLTADWCAERGVQSMGHPPGNYCINSTDMHGDILKFYRHTQIPLTDYIFYYGHGRDGFKQVSSAADLYDRPVVGAEVCGAFAADMDSLMLYRVALDLFARGVNFLVPHGMWYDPSPEHVRIPPLIAPYNPILSPTLKKYSDFAARSSLLLQGGSRVSDIALLYPITSAQAHFKFDVGDGWGESAPPELDYHKISGLLTTVLRQDFTLVHPESFVNGKIIREKNRMVLDNRENRQEYRVVILPGGKVFSAETMEWVRDFYEHGGRVLATSELPVTAAEFGQDCRLQEAVNAVFGAASQRESGVVRSDSHGGKALFVADPSATSLRKALAELRPDMDVEFEDDQARSRVSGVSQITNKMTTSDEDVETGDAARSTVGGSFCYIHKQKDDQQIYFFSNSTDDSFSTPVWLRGALQQLQYWNPYTGEMQDLKCKQEQRHGRTYTRFVLDMPAVTGCFVIGK